MKILERILMRKSFNLTFTKYLRSFINLVYKYVNSEQKVEVITALEVTHFFQFETTLIIYGKPLTSAFSRPDYFNVKSIIPKTRYSLTLQNLKKNFKHHID